MEVTGGLNDSLKSIADCPDHAEIVAQFAHVFLSPSVGTLPILLGKQLSILKTV